MKTCETCKKELNPKRFYKAPAQPDGRGKVCKLCLKKADEAKPLSTSIGKKSEAMLAREKAMRELACDLYLSGMNGRAALKQAGYSANTVNCANKWFNQRYVLNMLEERRERLMAKRELTKEWIVERLMSIADTSVGDVLEVDEDGNLYPDWNKMSDEMKHNIASFDVESSMVGRGDGKKPVTKVKVRQADRQKALDSLARIGGFDKQVFEVHTMTDTAKQLMEANTRLVTEDE